MIDDLYSREILRLTTDLRLIGRLSDPDGTANCTARLCGSTINVDIKIKDHKIIGFAQEVKACALGQATAALVSHHIMGATTDEIEATYIAMKARLNGDDHAYPARFESLKIMDQVRDYPVRHASTLLCLEATTKAIEMAHFKR